MSRVSGVTLICSLCEGVEEDEGASIIRMLDEAAGHSCFTPLVGHCFFTQLTDHYGGNKHPQIMALGAGINGFDEDLFATKVMAHPWEYPENVVLVIQPEDGPTRTWRPSPPIELFVARDMLVKQPASETEPEYLKGLGRFLDRARVMLAPVPEAVLGEREAFVHRLALMLADLERRGSKDVRIKSVGPAGVEIEWTAPVPRDS
jgi:hypothetical protein